MSMILLRTHGGLGNQLFQSYFALCCKNHHGYDRIIRIHDNNYYHKFEADKNLEQIGLKASWAEATLSAMRIPKIMKKLFRFDREFLDLGCINILDGYFQDKTSYGQFSSNSKSDALSQLRAIMEVRETNTVIPRRLEHIRLGDFFSNSLSEEAAARNILASIKTASDIITNNEHLVQSICLEGHLPTELNLITTDGMSGIELLHLMGQYEEISSNNSTLALWAALLYKRQLYLESPSLNEFFLSEVGSIMKSS